ncbi:MAG: hypothetical protein QM668_11945, partial [Agriterribacter sp.]
DRLPYFTRGRKIQAKDIYMITEKDFIVADLAIRYKGSALDPFGTLIPLGDISGIGRIRDVNTTMHFAQDTWSLKFANAVQPPQKLWMVIRYTVTGKNVLI